MIELSSAIRCSGRARRASYGILLSGGERRGQRQEDAWRDGWMKVEDMHDVRSQMSVNIRRQPRACSDINHNGPLDWISNDI
jgi:hypothetical protein